MRSGLAVWLFVCLAVCQDDLGNDPAAPQLLDPFADVEIDDDLPGDDQVDKWDSIPLPAPPAELVLDSEAVARAEQSEVRQELEAEIQAYGQLHAASPGNLEAIVGDEVGEWGEDFREEWFKKHVASKEVHAGAYGDLYIFNTDDFDDDWDDVDGDSPFAPPVV